MQTQTQTQNPGPEYLQYVRGTLRSAEPGLLMYVKDKQQRVEITFNHFAVER